MVMGIMGMFWRGMSKLFQGCSMLLVELYIVDVITSIVQ